MVQTLENPLILIDGSSYLYQAYHAFSFLTNSIGKPIGAIYGVLNMLRRLVIRYKPTHAAVIFDAKGKTFRNEIFRYYKYNRSPMQENLYVQIKPLHAMIKAMGFPMIIISGVEADDIIGTLACNAEKIGRLVLIVTKDKDMAQLVTSRVILTNSVNSSESGPEEVTQKYGVPPSLIIDLLALVGDSSDNIPGVPGIGEKTAKILLQRFGGLNSIYKQVDKIVELTFRGSRNMASILEKNKEIAYLSYRLATIKTDVTLDVSCDQLTLQKLEEKELLILFKEYEFQRWASEIEAGKWL